MNQLYDLLHRLLCLILRVSHSVGPVRSENLISNKFPDHAVAAASQGSYLENHCSTPHPDPPRAGFYWATVAAREIRESKNLTRLANL